MTRLKIELAGDTPGLPENRISLSEFAPAFARMLRAVRRIASGMVQDAYPGRDYGVTGGRYTAEGGSMDLEISAIRSGSPTTVIDMELVQRYEPTPTLPFFEHLTDRTADYFVDAIKKEAAGERHNDVVRKFLIAMPRSVRSQTYTVTPTEGESKTVTVGEVLVVDERPQLPYLLRFNAVVVGAGWEPGRNEVKLKSEKYGSLGCVATDERVEQALKIRDQQNREVHALVVREPSGLTRLLRMSSFDAPPFVPSKQDRETYLFEKWDELLTRLAE